MLRCMLGSVKRENPTGEGENLGNGNGKKTKN